jgi:hypothetical protein
MNTFTILAWLGLATYSVHILEEFTFNWRDWARSVLKLPVEWDTFYVTNGIVVALGIAQAMLAPALPVAPLAFAGIMIINTLFFHLLPVVITRRFSPGVTTATLLMLPLGVAIYWVALATGVADAGIAIAGLVIGALLMAYPIVLLRLKDRPPFKQA